MCSVVRRIRADEALRLRAFRLRALADAPTAFGSTLAREEAFPESVWHERASAGAAGSELRLGAAKDLQMKLALILEGEAPYDIFVRWKPIEEQSLGWEPDVNDGVRLKARFRRALLGESADVLPEER